MTMDKWPKVAIIVFNWNGWWDTVECLESLQQVDYPDYQIIVVDNDLTDELKTVVEPHFIDSWTKFIQHGRNTRIPAVRNTAIKCNKGKYILCLDHNNLWLLGKLESQISNFKKISPDACVVFSNMKVANRKGVTKRYSSVDDVLFHISQLSPHKVMRALFFYNFVPMVVVRIRRKCINTVGILVENIREGVHNYIFCLCLPIKYTVKYLSIPLSIYRTNETDYLNVERLFQNSPIIKYKSSAKYSFLAFLRRKKLIMLYYNSLVRYHQLKGYFHNASVIFLGVVKYWPLHVKAGFCIFFMSFGFCKEFNLASILGYTK